MKFPTNKELAEILDIISDDDFVQLLPSDASPVEKVKYQLCKKFVTYIQDNNLSQIELAKKLNIDKSRVNWIVHYKIENFTIDRLYELLILVLPSFELKVSKSKK